jgi:hypothetical protein
MPPSPLPAALVRTGSSPIAPPQMRILGKLLSPCMIGRWIATLGGRTMLRKTICTMLILIMMVGAASAQKNTNAVPGYPRSDQEKKNDKEIDRAYQSTIKGRQDAVKNSDPWGNVRPTQPAAAVKNKQQ